MVTHKPASFINANIVHQSSKLGLCDIHCVLFMLCNPKTRHRCSESFEYESENNEEYNLIYNTFVLQLYINETGHEEYRAHPHIE